MKSLITWKKVWTILRNNILMFSLEEHSCYPSKKKPALFSGPGTRTKVELWCVATALVSVDKAWVVIT